MTARSMFQRLAEYVGAESRNQLSKDVGIPESHIRRMESREGLYMSTLRRIHERSRVPIGILAEWWLEDEEGFSKMRPQEKVYGLTPEIEARMFGAIEQREEETQ